MRIVIDTNAIISAALFENSTPGQALALALRRGDLLLSLATLAELSEVLRRPKFARYVTPAESEEFLATLVERATFIEIRDEIIACRDPKDDKFLEVAVNGSADCIVSGDADLRILHPFRGILILSPDEFLRLYSSSP